MRQPVRRSGLTMPVVTTRFVENAWLRGCDYIVLDLEDSVPQHLKQHARTLVKDAIPVVARGGAQVYVRINHDSILEDLEAVVWPGLAKVRYPKAEYPEEICRIDRIITYLELARSIESGSILIEPLIETSKGVNNALEMARASPRVHDFTGGAGYDMSMDLGVEMFVPFDQFVYGKGELALATRTAGIDLPSKPFMANSTGSVSSADLAFREAEAARKCGFHYGGGFNPAVVQPHNTGYTPTPEEVQDAQWVVQQYSGLVERDEVWAEISGRVIDCYEASRARKTIEWAEQCRIRDEEKKAAVRSAQGTQGTQA